MQPSQNIEKMQGRISDIIRKIRDLDRPRSQARPEAAQKPQEIRFRSDLEQQKTGASRPTPTEGNFEQKLNQWIRKSAGKNGVSPELLQAVINTESGGRVDARSPAGALGLMQLMPATARGLKVNPLNPADNIDGGARYLRSMAEKFDSLDQVLAAYNAGPGAVKKYRGVPPYRETRNYIRQIRNQLNGDRIDLRR